MPSFISSGIGALGAGLLGAGASIFGGNAGADAAEHAADVQAQSAQQSAALQAAMFREIQTNLAPWLNAGKSALPILQQLTGTNEGGNPLTAELTKRFNPDMATLAATPGYQFVRDQGLRSVQNSFAAKGLGSSGAAIRGGTDYAEGLAGTTFQQQLQNFMAQNQQTYNMLGGISGSGQNAAAQQGSLGLQAAGNIGNALTSGAAATAGGIVGGQNALTAGITGAANAAGGGLLLNSLYGQGASGSPSGMYNNTGVNLSGPSADFNINPWLETGRGGYG